MKARDLVFIAIVLVAVGGLYYLSTKGKVRPMPPNPPEHLTAKTREDCLKCHSSQTLAALEQAHKHPGKWRDEKVSCLRCHQAPPAKTMLDFRFRILDPESLAQAKIQNPKSKIQKGSHHGASKSEIE
jgi:hypothetical protein